MRLSNWRRAVLAVLIPPYLVLAVRVGLVSNLAILVARISRLLIAASREFVALNLAAAWQVGRVRRHWDSVQVGPVPSTSGWDKGGAGNTLCGGAGGRIDQVRARIVDCRR